VVRIGEEEPEWRVGCAPSVRLRASEELGWAHIRGLAVGPVQQWLRDTLERQQRTYSAPPTSGPHEETVPRHTACTLGRGAATTRLTPCAAQHQRRQTRRQTRKQTPSPRRRLSSRSSRSMTPLAHATLTLTAAIDFDDSHTVDRDLTKEKVEKREPP